MRRLECARPPRTAIGHARNAGEAVQQLAHLARERQRLTQERRAVMRRIRKIDARLQAISGLENKLMPMIQGEPARTAERVPSAPAPRAAAAPAPKAAPAVAPKRHVSVPPGLGEVTLQY